MKLSKTLIVLVALAMGMLTIVSAKAKTPTKPSVGTGCRTPGSC
jgi:hypothetical protein